ncbi:MAG: hypothetical protein KF878_16370 [Planctomycetes bacterium]|nr:hypothetical protein [Planctomycetota bacterium]
MSDYCRRMEVIGASYGKRARLITRFDAPVGAEIRVIDLGEPIPGEGEGSRMMGYVPTVRRPGLLGWLVGWPLCGVRLDEIVEFVPLELE